jgi:hypothetical protein
MATRRQRRHRLRSDAPALHRQVQARQRRTPCLVDNVLEEEIALEELGRKVTARLGERAHAIEVDVDDLAGEWKPGTG